MKPRIRSKSSKDKDAIKTTTGNTRPVIKVVIHKAPCYPHWVEIFHRSTSQKGVSP
jgi:hypothetical protein